MILQHGLFNKKLIKETQQNVLELENVNDITFNLKPREEITSKLLKTFEDINNEIIVIKISN